MYIYYEDVFGTTDVCDSYNYLLIYLTEYCGSLLYAFTFFCLSFLKWRWLPIPRVTVVLGFFFFFFYMSTYHQTRHSASIATTPHQIPSPPHRPGLWFLRVHSVEFSSRLVTVYEYISKSIVYRYYTTYSYTVHEFHPELGSDPDYVLKYTPLNVYDSHEGSKYEIGRPIPNSEPSVSGRWENRKFAQKCTVGIVRHAKRTVYFQKYTFLWI